MSTYQEIKLRDVERLIDYQPQKPEHAYLWEALQIAGSGITTVGGRSVNKGNQRLAVLGDAVMASAMADYWFQHGGTKGSWSTTRSSVLSIQKLARIALDKGLVSCMNGNPMNPVAPSERLSATLVEAILGAVYLDGGMTEVKTVMHNIGISEVSFYVNENNGTSQDCPYEEHPGEACELQLLLIHFLKRR